MRWVTGSGVEWSGVDEMERDVLEWILKIGIGVGVAMRGSVCACVPNDGCLELSLTP